MPPPTADQASQDALGPTPRRPASAADSAGPPSPPADWIDLLRATLLADLKVLPRIAADLPTGGVPRAGYLAQHCYVVCEALEHHIEVQRRAAPDGATRPLGDRPDPDSEELVGALGEVVPRIGRLYSAERPGGLDRIDAHLLRLHRAAKTYLDRTGDRSSPGSGGDDPAASRWWEGLGHRPRARILGWAVAAHPAPAEPIVRSQPLMTRLIVVTAGKRQARQRAERLGLAGGRP